MSSIRKSAPTDPYGTPGEPTRWAGAWPIPWVSLAALTDLGMSDDLIGRYLGIDPTAVPNVRTAGQSNCSALMAANSR